MEEKFKKGKILRKLENSSIKIFPDLVQSLSRSPSLSLFVDSVLVITKEKKHKLKKNNWLY